MPNRIIKESIRTSKNVNSLSDFEFRVWTYLITYVDDYGRGSADPELLKGMVFPRRQGLTEQQITKALDTLANTGMVILYTVDGEPYLCFPKWDKHQQIRAKKSRFPAPDEGTISNDITRNQPISNDSTCPRNPIQSESESESNNNSTLTREFEELWALYPRKQGKKRAFEAYCRDRKKGTTVEQIRQGIEAYVRYLQAEGTEEQYIKQGDTFFAQAAWQDQWTPRRKTVGRNGITLLPETDIRGESIFD